MPPSLHHMHHSPPPMCAHLSASGCCSQLSILPTRTSSACRAATSSALTAPASSPPAALLLDTSSSELVQDTVDADEEVADDVLLLLLLLSVLLVALLTAAAGVSAPVLILGTRTKPPCCSGTWAMMASLQADRCCNCSVIKCAHTGRQAGCLFPALASLARWKPKAGSVLVNQLRCWQAQHSTAEHIHKTSADAAFPTCHSNTAGLPFRPVYNLVGAVDCASIFDSSMLAGLPPLLLELRLASCSQL